MDLGLPMSPPLQKIPRYRKERYTVPRTWCPNDDKARYRLGEYSEKLEHVPGEYPGSPGRVPGDPGESRETPGSPRGAPGSPGEYRGGPRGVPRVSRGVHREYPGSPGRVPGDPTGSPGRPRGGPEITQKGSRRRPRAAQGVPREPQETPRWLQGHPSAPQGAPGVCQGIADETRKPGCKVFTMVSKGPLGVPTRNIAKHGVKWRHRPGIDGICNGLAGSTGDPRDAQGPTRSPKGAQEEPR